MQAYLSQNDEVHIRNLRKQLEAADEQLKYKTWVVESLHRKLDCYKYLGNISATRYETARKECENIKLQHSATSKDAESSICQLKQKLQTTKSELDQSTEQNNKLTMEQERLSRELEREKSTNLALVKEREVQDHTIKEVK